MAASGGSRWVFYLLNATLNTCIDQSQHTLPFPEPGVQTENYVFTADYDALVGCG